MKSKKHYYIKKLKDIKYSSVEAYSTLILVNNLNGFLITQEFPQTIRGKYDESVTWLKTA